MDSFHSVVGWAPGPAHAFYAARVGRRVGGAACLHPGIGAVVCWALWKVLTLPELVAGLDAADTRHLLLESHGPGRVAGTAAIAAAVFQALGATLATGAVLLALVNLFSAPTHARTHDGRLRRLKGLQRPSMAERHRSPGRYARVKTGHGGIMKDWRAAKGDAANMDRRLGRVGAWSLKRWARRWSYEDAVGAERSQPGRVGRALHRRADPPKDGPVKRAAAKMGARVGTTKAERKAGPADYPADDLPPAPPPDPPMPRLDPTAGPPAPSGDVGDVGDGIREAILAELIDMQTPAEPVAAGNGSKP
jgi:hypothetical protein